jgi:DNA polymerase-3 subunit alpha
MITQAKRIRTKKGDWMMFATLYDLEASVEIIVFDKALTASEDALSTDSIVLVRGRVDHKDRDKTCVVAQQVERFEPSQEEVAQAQEEAAKQVVAPTALRLCLDATSLPATMLGELKDVLAGFPGESEVLIELTTSMGRRCLKLGPSFRVSRNASLHAELDALLGPALIDGARAEAEPEAEAEAAEATPAAASVA